MGVHRKEKTEREIKEAIHPAFFKDLFLGHDEIGRAHV